MQPIKNIVQLRQLLLERFPHLRMAAESPSAKPHACCPTGLPQIDNLLKGGLPQGEIVEMVSSGTGSGLVILSLLRQAYEARQWIALIDGQDCFDPSAVDADVLWRLLWIRCRNAEQALKAADLLLRDSNLPLVLLDLQINSATQLRKIPSSTWRRFQRLIESSSTALLVLTPRALVGNAQARLSLQGKFHNSILVPTHRRAHASVESDTGAAARFDGERRRRRSDGGGGLMFAVIYIPDFALQASLRCEPELHSRPAVPHRFSRSTKRENLWLSCTWKASNLPSKC